MEKMSELQITLNVVCCVSLEFVFVDLVFVLFCVVVFVFMNYLHLNCTCEGQYIV